MYRGIYNIICVDLYGFGQSNSPEPFFDTYEYATQIYLFLRSKGIRRIDIIAHSFGGRIATIISSMFDIEVNKLVLTGSAGLKPRRGMMYYIQIARYKLRKKLHISTIGSGSEDYKKSTPTMRSVLVRVVNQHLDYLLSHIKSKTLLIWGERDKSTQIYMCKKYQKYINHASVYIVPRAEHFVLFSHIFICNNRLKEFLIYD